MERFKKVMEMAFNNEWINRNPVKALKAHKEKTDINELDEEAVKRLSTVILPPNLGIVRDLFIFAVYTGVSYEDMTRLNAKEHRYRHRQKPVAALQTGQNRCPCIIAITRTCIGNYQ